MDKYELSYSKTIENTENLEDLLVRTLKENSLVVTGAESLTGGLISGRITSVPGASEVFGESYVTYSNNAKMRVLGVPKDILDKYGAVSEICVGEMLKGALERSTADIAYAVSGNAGPTSLEDKEKGLVYIGVLYKGNSHILERHFSGNRADVREDTINCTLELIIKTVMEEL